MNQAGEHLNLHLCSLEEHFSHCLHGKREGVFSFIELKLLVIPSQLANKIDSIS